MKTKPFKTGKDGHNWVDVLAWRTGQKKAGRKLRKKIYKALKIKEKNKFKRELNQT